MTGIYLKVNHSDVVFSSNIEGTLLFAISLLLNSGNLPIWGSYSVLMYWALQRFQDTFCESPLL